MHAMHASEAALVAHDEVPKAYYVGTLLVGGDQEMQARQHLPVSKSGAEIVRSSLAGLL